MSEALVNKGIAIVGAPDLENNSIAVIGTARGGTSMIAGVLAKLGVFMGDRAVPPVFEDVRLSDVMESKDFKRAKKIISEYSAKHAKWGWKRPSSIEYLDDVEKVFGSPAYVFVFKDIFSIAQRNSISMLSEVLPSMKRAHEQYGMALDFLRKSSPYAMLVSYDKAVSYPEGLVSSLIDFYGLSPTEQQIQDAVAFITPNPTDYLDASRITKGQGRLDGVKNGRTIYGWARYVHTKKAAEVDIYLNDTRIGSVLADKPRPDVEKRFGQACAYLFELPEDITLSVGDKLRVRVANDVKDLNASPLTIDDIYSEEPELEINRE